MIKNRKQIGASHGKGVSGVLTCICILILVAAPILVRVSTAFYPNLSETEREAYQDSHGDWFLTDPDSYYHVRIVDNHLKTGTPGDRVLADGTPWDSLSSWPEGRDAAYSPGIIYWTEAVWKPLNMLFGVRLRDVEFCLAAVMSAFTALAAFFLVRRMSGPLGGLAAGILASCAPAFALRTGFGRFDTDMFVILMDLLLILFLTEALRKGDRGRCLAFSGAFVATAVLYSYCWSPEAVLLIAGMALAGGLVFALWNGIDSARQAGKRAICGIRTREAAVVFGCGAVVLAVFMLCYGTGIAGSLLSYAGLTSAYRTGSGVLPNEYMLISELEVPSFLPGRFGQWFLDPRPQGGISVVTGIGGMMALLLGAWALIRLAVRSVRGGKHARKEPADTMKARMYGCVLLALSIGWLFLLRYGFRFVEHFAVPVCLLAGAGVGWVGSLVWRTLGKTKRPAAVLVASAVFLAVVSPSVVDAASILSGFTPSVTRVSEEAMDWIRDNAGDPEAVLISWWDNGYYYEQASGHPCLWDGGSIHPLRALLVSKALTADDPELSRRILLMLSSSGHQAAEKLLERTDAQTAFGSLWEALMMEREEACRYLAEQCGLTAAEAAEIGSLLRPDVPKETYLLLTDTMMMQYGWFEYYGFWDFSGDTAEPRNTSFDSTPDGYPIDRPEARRYMENIRSRETLWRIYLQGEETGALTCVFRGDDGLEHLRIWRVER